MAKSETCCIMTMLKQIGAEFGFQTPTQHCSKTLTPALGVTPGLRKLMDYNFCFAFEKLDVARNYFVEHSDFCFCFVQKKN